MNSPAYLVSKITQRAQYNIGKVLKEAGLGNSSYILKIVFSYGPIWISYV